MTHTWDLKPVYSKVDLGLGQDWDTTGTNLRRRLEGLWTKFYTRFLAGFRISPVGQRMRGPEKSWLLPSSSSRPETMLSLRRRADSDLPRSPRGMNTPHRRSLPS
jgi:hypothetical protein